MNKILIKEVIKEMIDTGEIKVDVQLDVSKAFIDSEGMIDCSGGDFVTDVEIFVDLEAGGSDE